MRGDGKASPLRRIVVVGGAGFFGRNVVELLRSMDLHPIVAGRSGELRVDAEDPRSLRAVLHAGDVIVDAAGPYQSRTTSLVDTAMEIGADVIDLNEGIDYAKAVSGLDARASERDVAILSSCSAVSTVAAILVRISGVERPRRVSALVAPASRTTANPGTVHALLRSIGRPVEVRRNGAPHVATGWRETRRFELPPRRGHLVGSALPVTLLEIWPGLRDVDCWTDTGTLGANAVLSVASLSGALRALAEALMPLGQLAARLLGATRGAFAVEIEDEGGRIERLALTSARRSYLIAAAPAALAARALAEGRFTERGVIRADRHVNADELLGYLQGLGIELLRD